LITPISAFPQVKPQGEKRERAQLFDDIMPPKAVASGNLESKGLKILVSSVG